MEDPGYTLLIDPEDEPDGSESRLNRITKQPSDTPKKSEPVFESWYEPQLSRPEPYVVNAERSSAAQPVEETSPLVAGKKPPSKKTASLAPFILMALVLILFLVPILIPVRVTTLVLGIDRPPKGTWIGRSDTMILTTLKPASTQVSLVSIPRDLWVAIPNYGENRINAAHYFAELTTENTGMQGAREVVETNFGIDVDYVLRIKFDGFIEVVDAFGGVTVDLPAEMSGLTAGKHLLNGTEALKFVRDRKGSDDFFRQQRGQLFISAMFKEALNPLKWPRFPAVMLAISKNVQTDIPIWLWPRLAISFTLSALNGFDAHVFDRTYVTPWVTEDGAQVLLPKWELILPAVQQIF
mgnify:FL=1